jgi:cellulose biosynthesis protein BcsQ
MAKIIMFGNQKGGVGKSLCGMMTATAISQAPFGFKTCVVDIDDQKSIFHARNIDIQSYPEGTTEPYDILPMNVADLQKRIGELDKKYQLIIIDAAGKLDANAEVNQQEITKSLMYVDFLFMPFVAGTFNFTASYQYFEFVKQVQLARQLQTRPLRVAAFVNMYRSRSRSNAFLLQDLESLDDTPKMSVYLNDYAVFKDADSITSLYDSLSTDTAKLNFSEWLNELTKIIGITE